MTPKLRLQQRLMLAFSGFALLLTLLFALLSFGFVYAVEDRLFEAMVDEEAKHLLHSKRENGAWDPPRHAYMRLHTDLATLPEDLRQILEEEPARKEVAGAEGRHYHIKRLAVEPEVLLVAEVSDLLVVRPMRAGLFELLAGVSALSLGLAVLIAHRMAKRAAAPVVQLVERVAALKPTDLPYDFVESRGDDEVAVLERGLEQLIRRIHALIEREQAFTRDASHELRTPLTVIRLGLARVAEEPSLSSAARTQLQFMQQSVRALEHIVSSLLALTREQSESSEPATTRVLPLIERCIVDHSFLLDGKSVQVDLDVADDACLPVPAAAAQMLLANLIGNAFAHSVDGKVSIEDSQGTLCIRNTYAADQLPAAQQLGEPFVKGERSQGFGLGLALVRRLALHYGIDLQIGCEAEEFVARLPLVSMASRPEAPRHT